jgi:hypothetical protein
MAKAKKAQELHDRHLKEQDNNYRKEVGSVHAKNIQ